MALAVALFAAQVVGFIAFSAGFGRAFLTAPILFMVAGVLVGRVEAFAAIDHGVIQTIAEVTLALLLFHDASQLQPRELRADAPLTGRLLLIGLPLTTAAGYLLALGVRPSPPDGRDTGDRGPAPDVRARLRPLRSRARLHEGALSDRASGDVA
jgi:sodium/hydrogen antiporter